MQQEAGGADHVSWEMEEGKPVTWDCGSPLYDYFELVSMYHVLDRHLMILPFPSGALPRREHHHGVASLLDADHGAARLATKKARGTMWKGMKAVAAIYEAATCCRKL
jgi:hypothetical protein